MKYKRILLKLSGESLAGKLDSGIDPARLESYASQVHDIARAGVQVGIVTGGGNIFRGLKGAGAGFDRVKGDQMGMLATIINGLALGSALERAGSPVKLMTATRVDLAGELYSRDKAVEYLREGHVVLFCGGTGNPFFTTDTAACLRAIETGAEVVLKGTRVDGVYSADPERDPLAVKLDRVSHDDLYRRGLKVMDLTAVTLCKENGLPIVVFNMNVPGNLSRVVTGEPVGTIVYRE